MGYNINNINLFKEKCHKTLGVKKTSSDFQTNSSLRPCDLTQKLYEFKLKKKKKHFERNVSGRTIFYFICK